MVSASPWSWVTKTTVRPSSECSRLISSCISSSQKSCRARESGSSISRTRGRRRWRGAKRHALLLAAGQLLGHSVAVAGETTVSRAASAWRRRSLFRHARAILKLGKRGKGEGGGEKKKQTLSATLRWGKQRVVLENTMPMLALVMWKPGASPRRRMTDPGLPWGARNPAILSAPFDCRKPLGPRSARTNSPASIVSETSSTAPNRVRTAIFQAPRMSIEAQFGLRRRLLMAWKLRPGRPGRIEAPAAFCQGTLHYNIRKAQVILLSPHRSANCCAERHCSERKF